MIIICGVILSLTACGQSAAEPPEDTGSKVTNITSSDISDISTADPVNSSQSTEPELSESKTTSPATNSKATSSPANSSAGTTSKPKPPSSTAPAESNPAQPSSAPSSTLNTHNDALPSDNTAIAEKLIEKINEYRMAQGAGKAAKLPGLTQVAQYRSNQLVTNYAHDTNDLREAARIYQYGEHIVYEEYGLDYFDTKAAEAIGKSGGNNTVDEIAKIMATGFKNSVNHWSYVGSANFKYIAVGATYGNGQWYICILMSQTREYEDK